MDRAFVVLDGSESEEGLLREAAQFAACVDASLVLCSFVDAKEMDEYDETIEAIEHSERTSYGAEAREGVSEQHARQTAETVLSDIDVAYETTGFVSDGEYASEVVRLATEYDCDHVYIVGRRRSPTGKAVFGDSTQRVILNFDGPVTVVTE